jgi:hypothetical protein
MLWVMMPVREKISPTKEGRFSSRHKKKLWQEPKAED